MIFTYPLGFLVLLLIPVLILIYILKNKYTEQTVASTYIWRVSERFFKNRHPISKLYGLISLILQILCICFISIAIVQPVIVMPNQAYDMCFVLDGSGSMKMVNEQGISRFDEGKEKIAEIISSSKKGSQYTLVYVGESPRVIFEKITSKEKANNYLYDLACTDLSTNCSNALVYAQKYYDDNHSLKTYLVSDKDYDISENIELINLSLDVDNFAISNTQYKITSSGIEVTGEVISYKKEADVVVELYIDGAKINEQTVNVKELENNEFTFSTSVKTFDEIKAVITNQDALKEDNEQIIYNLANEHEYYTLLVSDQPIYLSSVLKTMGHTSLTVISTKDYSEKISGYGLYVFDSFAPSVFPTDGTLWLFNLQENLNSLNISFQEEVAIEDPEPLTPVTPDNSVSKALTKDLRGDDIYVSKYVKYGLYQNFYNLYTYNGNPVIFVGNSTGGNREVVFAFDLHNSNFPLLSDYLVLVNNMIDFSFPSIMDKNDFTCGETVNINILSNTKSIKVTSPSLKTSYLDISGTISEFVTEEVGTYQVEVTIGENTKTFKVFSSSNLKESVIDTQKDIFVLQGESESNYLNAIYDDLLVVFIVLMLIFVADWMVYTYEQHQL